MLTSNEYFGGKVKSIGFQSKTLAATVGVMAIGDYEFATAQKEVMTIVSGELSVKLPDASDWQTFVDGQQFCIAAGATFLVNAAVETAYLCTYE